MTDLSTAAPRPVLRGASIGVAALAIAALGLVFFNLSTVAGSESWLQLLFAPDLEDPRQTVAYFSTFPRIALAIVTGLALGFAGSVFQAVLRNPLAEPGLLGVTSGAQLALAASLLYAPALWTEGYELVALGGGVFVFALVALAASGRGASAPAFILTGVVVSLYCNALYGLLILFHHDFLSDLLAWQAGSLQQSGWQSVARLTAQAGIVGLAMLFLLRPLRILSLGDGPARSLGLSPALVKVSLLGLASTLAALVTAEIGIVGFIGLAAPALARHAWPRQFANPIPAALVGAALLLFIDQALGLIAPYAGDIPAGAAAGLFTGPLLAILAVTGRQADRPRTDRMPLPSRRLARPSFALGALATLLVLAAGLSLLTGFGDGGWQIVSPTDPDLPWHWRLPRLLGAAGAGACLAIAGLLLQRALRNPLASPDLVGVGHGAGLGLIIAFMIVPAGAVWSKLAVSAAGAAAVLVLVAVLARRASFQPERTLLVGVGLGSMVHALLVLFLASGGPNGAALLSWFSGSIGAVRIAEGVMVCVVALATVVVALVFHRWLAALPLGDQTSLSIGITPRIARTMLFAVAAVAIAAATMIVGPVSFVGLIVPHLVSQAGFQRTRDIVLACALSGAIFLVGADFIGRNLAWPWPMAPGLIAALLGGPIFLWLIWRGRSQ
ncbi:Fe(3+)-hydroxamate ABC transporter permease FhuB [Ensifer sp.]|jgi:iron complex transport system permease protein|uniref:Fe(3+)-hydroxamate ABC transporter permease FhuB n=1 Tax=Ensifer sp. TaxID=1872086 RepID=UPI002E0F49BE|nr:Fe(3+)-hydroxamate ABC transporter permease FhuB [Ensifer sp.]